MLDIMKQNVQPLNRSNKKSIVYVKWAS